jgi:hypothetical protein
LCCDNSCRADDKRDSGNFPHSLTVEYRLQRCNFLVPARDTRGPMKECAAVKAP